MMWTHVDGDDDAGCISCQDDGDFDTASHDADIDEETSIAFEDEFDSLVCWCGHGITRRDVDRILTGMR